MTYRRRYAIVGTGARSEMYIRAMALSIYGEDAKLVALCDSSQSRLNYWSETLTGMSGASVPTFLATDFNRMLDTVRPDVVIVTTVDYVHHKYIIESVQQGCDVICEKPITTDVDKARDILDAVARTGRRVCVTFNCRYMPFATAVKKLISEGAVGTPLSVDLQWVLNTSHGADYFRRWHREKAYSGGLLVHKSTHHFDLISYWLGASPKSVFALGDLKFYGRSNAVARGESYNYDRYTGVSGAATDPFALDLSHQQRLRGLYLDAEADSGYIRDRNVFSEGITIEDTMNVLARYDNDVVLNYSLLAYSPREGFRASITGTKGRIEIMQDCEFSDGSESTEQDADDEQRGQLAVCSATELSLTYYPMFKAPVRIDVPTVAGGHGGADALLLEQLFRADPARDLYGRSADHIDGIEAVLLGACANISIDCGKMVHLKDVLDLHQYR